MVSHAQIDSGLVKRLYQKANAARWGLTLDRFREVLESSIAHAAPDATTGSRAGRLLASLHLEDLALAAACADGSDNAWEHFIREHRPTLYRAADAIDRTGGAREAADALYGELFGLTERDGERRSLFRYFHGRSSLPTWLRAVLAQRYVDGLRRARRLVALSDDEEPPATGNAEPVDPDRHRFVALMRETIATATSRLEARDRLRLACYYAQGLTLVQIGRTLREHEATVSRHLARTRRLIRQDVEQQLRQKGMTEKEISECFASVVEDAGPLDVREMLADSRKKPNQERST
jgi:RNA polymerase sigma-70 factor, ECF subfamily